MSSYFTHMVFYLPRDAKYAHGYAVRLIGAKLW